jgi:hypothetical protein
MKKPVGNAIFYRLFLKKSHSEKNFRFSSDLGFTFT